MNETLVIVGPNACGKSTYVDKMVREYTFRYSADHVRYLTFRDTYGAADAGYYLQQRWNSGEYDLVPTVAESLGTPADPQMWERVSGMFGLEEMLPKPLIMLSSGELRKYQLARAIASGPKVLIIDSPFIGLDEAARGQFSALLGALAAGDDIQLILVVARECDVPSFATRIMPMEAVPTEAISIDEACAKVAALGGSDPGYENAVCLDKVSIRFGERTILKELDWIMKAGEKWALEGPNGSGKSTLLSIICADIPQAYACKVTLFDRRRGTGESIWDIKKHIGFVSPELHRAYSHNVSVLDVVASGLHDRKGMYVKTSEEHIPDCEFWLSVFGISHLRDRSFLKISSGEQRLVLLARAFVKDPDLLILDEPLHGLDENNGERVKAIIDAFASRKGKSLIMVSHYKEDFPPCISKHLLLQKH